MDLRDDLGDREIEEAEFCVVFFWPRLDERGLGRPRERRPRCRRRVALAAVGGFFHGRRGAASRLALFRHVGAGLGGVAGQLN